MRRQYLNYLQNLQDKKGINNKKLN